MIKRAFSDLFGHIGYELTCVRWGISIFLGILLGGVTGLALFLQTLARRLFFLVVFMAAVLVFNSKAQAVVKSQVYPDAPVTRFYSIEQSLSGIAVSSSSACPISSTVAITCSHSLPKDLQEGQTTAIYFPFSEVGRILSGPEAPTHRIGDCPVAEIQVKLLGRGVSADVSGDPSQDVAVIELHAPGRFWGRVSCDYQQRHG
jgi:hypothetical protein